ncbi:AAA family ATPase [Caenimonas terrae]|uniref:AAA family ATPase n=1 Tax=Caenimonas terrae TaxID=696074 RepID=A0ABW0NI72_9BURK
MDGASIAALARSLGAQVIETHISWVLLAGADAYKVKKPLRLSFVDYGSAGARLHFCREELRLNRRLAPALYLGVVPVTGSPQQPALGGAGPAQDHAVHMRRFADGALFSEQLAAGTLRPADVDALADLLAASHRAAPRAAPADGYGSPARRRAAALAALEGAKAAAGGGEQATLHGWLEAQAVALAPLWAARAVDGSVRECHGDLHLANAVRLDDGVAAFDCIEFDPALRWIDVLDDAAFAVMDFEALGFPGLAFRFLNRWLDAGGEHAGLPALRFALVYRALVRAQVACLRGPPAAADARRYLEAALRWCTPGAAQLTITHGLPGSGKTFASQRLLEQQGAIRLRSDVERKRLAGLAMLEDSQARGLDLYGADASARTYARLLALARVALAAGYPVILDAAFLRRAERDGARALARELALPFSILHCEAPPPVLRERLAARRGDASEADMAVLEKLLAVAEPLQADELPGVLRTEPGVDPGQGAPPGRGAA